MSFWWLIPAFLAGVAFGVVLVTLVIYEREDK